MNLEKQVFQENELKGKKITRKWTLRTKFVKKNELFGQI